MAVPSGLGSQLGMAAEAYVNEVQRISGTPSGTFGLSFEGYSGGATLATNASAAAIDTYLEAFPNIGTGGVTVTGGPLPTAVDITFAGPQVAARNVGALAVTGATTGLTFTTTTAGTGYGDAVTVSRFLPLLKEDVKLEVTDYESAGMYPNVTVQDSRLVSQTRRKVAGSVEVPFLTKGLGLLLDNAFGTSAVSTPTNGVLTRLHRFTLGSQQAGSLTMQVGRPDVRGTVNPFTWTGVMVDTAELSLEADGGCEWSFGLVAQNETTATALATASYASGTKQFHAGNTVTLTMNGVSFCVKDLTFKLENNLWTDRENLCSNLSGEPLNVGKRMVALECTAEFRDMQLYNYYQNGTIVPVVFSVRGDLIESVASPGPYYNEFRVTGAACRVKSDGPVVEGPDALEAKIEVLFWGDGTNEPCTFDVYTTDTAI
jgi:hypothetical protein